MKHLQLIVSGLLIALIGSCAKESGMHITTNTFADSKIIPYGFKQNASFSIATKQKGDPLFTKEVSQKIATILKNKGYTVTTDSNADYSLYFSFGMNKSTHVRDVPVFIPDYGHWYYYHYHPYHHYGYTIAYVPEEYTLFHKILLIEVYKNNGIRETKDEPIWQGTAHGYEEDSDLRDAIDYLLVTVFKHFGSNTAKYIRSKIQENDVDVQKLRQEYFQPIGYKKQK